MNSRPKFQRGEVVTVFSTKPGGTKFRVSDYYWDKKKEEYKYCLLSEELPTTKQEAHEFKLSKT